MSTKRNTFFVMMLYKELNSRFGTRFISDNNINLYNILYDGNNEIDISFLDRLVHYYSLKNKNDDNYICLCAYASSYPNLPEWFIDKWKDFLYWCDICTKQKLSEEFIENHYSYIYWTEVCLHQELSDSFIEKYKDKINWSFVSCQPLSEKFINIHLANLDLDFICKHQKLSESFMDNYRNLLNWKIICNYQYLSEEFIESHLGYIDWDRICLKQKLSEEFIKKYNGLLNWDIIAEHQKLSEEFIENNFDEFTWKICVYQKLSEKFIKKNINRLDLNLVSKYQKLPNDFFQNYKDKIQFYNDCWNYKPVSEKKQCIIDTGKYEFYDDYFIAYKAIRPDRYSLFNFQYKYEKGGIYESSCDTSNCKNSFGLSVGTKNSAGLYGFMTSIRYNIVRCKVRYEDVGRIVHNGDKVRCFKIEILD